MQPLFLFLFLKYFFMKNLSFILLAGVTLALTSCGVFATEEATAEVVEEEAADSTAIDSSAAEAVEAPVVEEAAEEASPADSTDTAE